MQHPDIALSIQQPWAWLIVNAGSYTPPKDVENRTWPLPRKMIGQRVLVHAGKTFDLEGYRQVRARFPHIKMPVPNEFDFGGIVGEVTLTGCVVQSSSPWFTGEYGFTLANPRPLPFRPCRGQLGFFSARYLREAA